MEVLVAIWLNWTHECLCAIKLYQKKVSLLASRRHFIILFNKAQSVISSSPWKFKYMKQRKLVWCADFDIRFIITVMTRTILIPVTILGFHLAISSSGHWGGNWLVKVVPMLAAVTWALEWAFPGWWSKPWRGWFSNRTVGEFGREEQGAEIGLRHWEKIKNQ